jgi:hypothetical protein
MAERRGFRLWTDSLSSAKEIVSSDMVLMFH